MPGLFVTFEGGEGSGKSTQIARLAARLRAARPRPAGDARARRHAARRGASATCCSTRRRAAAAPLAEALLHGGGARRPGRARRSRPALAAGRVVLCDRYDDSTLAYQGGGRGLDAALLAGLNRAATGGLVPDLTLLFDLAARARGRAAGGARAGGANRLDREPLEFHARVRARYLELAAAEPGRWVVLDAARAETSSAPPSRRRSRAGWAARAAARRAPPRVPKNLTSAARPAPGRRGGHPPAYARLEPIVSPARRMGARARSPPVPARNP